MTLTCKRCHNSKRVNPRERIAGIPVLQWFTERGELCAECYADNGHRATDPATSRAGAKDVTIRSGSQRHLLLQAYGDGSLLTADEAMRKAGVNERSCYWKRVSELVEFGLLEDAGMQRMGEQGSHQRVNRITQRGQAVVAATTPVGAQ